ncbi:preprotein translocase subunit SecE [Leptolyngbya sp. AN02str]|uniref:preprotein translocase subunit SecE n=1 Tax=Leptolyngbya sp. AN02str TaxID=3423363 RepID=UPI003D31363E
MADKEDTKVKEAKPAETKTSEEGSGFNASEFLKGTKEELDKVVWPSRQQLVSESIAVLLMVTISAVIVYLFDNLFSWIAQQVF